MKTDLVINNDLLGYLKRIDCRKNKKYEEHCKEIGVDPYDCQWVFKFDNGYGASVIKRWGSYGFDEDLFELAVIKWDNNDNWHLCYETNITEDVIGYLSNEDVMGYLYEINMGHLYEIEAIEEGDDNNEN